jgi:hypothetical protein
MSEFKLGDVVRRKTDGELAIILEGATWKDGTEAIDDRQIKGDRGMYRGRRSECANMYQGFIKEYWEVVFNLFEEFENDRNS